MAKKEKEESENQSTQKKPRWSLVRWLRGRFIAGMVIVAPIAVTVYVLQFIITTIDQVVLPLLPEVVKPETYINYAVPGFGLVVLLVSLTLLGAIAANLIGRSIIGLGDRIIDQIPVVKTIYASLRQLFNVIGNSQTVKFNRCVLVEYPRKGLWCVGFVSSEARGEIAEKMGEDYLGVFIPTSPNPTSGFLVFSHRDQVTDLDMSVEDGAKMILSGGLVVPQSQTEVAKIASSKKSISGESDSAKKAKS